MRRGMSWAGLGLLALVVTALVALAPRPGRAEGGAPAPSGSAAPKLLHNVVHIGDSFVDAGFRQAAGPKFAREGARYVPLSKTSSYLGTWAGTPEMIEIFYRYRPSLYLVTLGANEMAAPPASRVSLVRRIVKDLRGVPCVWVAVPAWKDAPTALNDMIRKEVAPCRYFDSTAVSSKIARQKDGIHPTVEGGAVWVDAFFTWLQAERDLARGPWALKAGP